jgi:4-amino-4-deoxy-L-arabinose transferase-like glycosyltransferase
LPESASPSLHYVSADWINGTILAPLALAVFTLVGRLLCIGSIYWADGPRHIRSILDKTYIIQPPGYWIFNRIAGLFHNPVTAISAMNISFSVAGVVVFYYVSLLFTDRKNAFLAALAYSAVFYIWFAGEVHSTYASQALFPISTFYALLCYDQRKTQRWLLWLAALLFAIGAGLRPSDGAFLLPMVMYFSAVRLTKKTGAFFLTLSLSLCLIWLIPTALAYRHGETGLPGAGLYMSDILKTRSIMAGINIYSLANVTRYALPLLVGFWPVLPAALLGLIQHWDDWRIKMMFLWILPGSLFFTLSYMSNAPYLVFLSAPVLLLAINAARMMVVTAMWNAVLFLSFTPIPSERLLVNIWNCYAIEYTRYAIDHKWSPNLSNVQQVTLRSK